ncbi:coiled-coil domain-containing protein 1-like [Ostrea edulis]|uniref:coiled-coil domain-containing protein 1-like n=1 Tax=Ostrea edulis TaxID=37623 RepID=UPI0024AF18B2|nr:coiled-coil domain-containing protein 1-like [Ostrea edulis]
MGHHKACDVIDLIRLDGMSDLRRLDGMGDPRRIDGMGITEDIKSDKFMNDREKTLLIIDDLMKDATQDKEICELFTEGAHHRRLRLADNSNRHLTADRQGDRQSLKLTSSSSNQHLTAEMAYQQRQVEEEENYAMSEVNDEDDDSGFTPLVNQVLEEIQSQFDKKLDQLMEENSKLTQREAREEVKDIMLPKDRALLLRKYKRILTLTSNLNKSKLHRGIREEVSSLMENTDIDVEKTISRVLNKHKQDFDELLDIDDNTDDEESDEEEESDNDDDDGDEEEPDD